jgi:plasmid stability protein
MRTSINLPDDLLAKARQRAADEGRTVTSLIEEGLRAVVTDRAAAMGATKRVLPRVSQARGGLLPGFDAIKLNTQTEELDDIDRLITIESTP